MYCNQFKYTINTSIINYRSGLHRKCQWDLLDAFCPTFVNLRLYSNHTLFSQSFLCVCKSLRLKLANCSHSTNQTVITGILPAFPSNDWAANLSCGLNSWKTASCGKTGGLCLSVYECMCVCVCVAIYIEFMALFVKKNKKTKHSKLYWIKLAGKSVSTWSEKMWECNISPESSP